MEELLSVGGPIRQRLLDAQEQARQEKIRAQQEREAEEKRIRDEAAAAKKAQEEANKPASDEMQIDGKEEGTVVQDEEMTDAATSVD